MAKNNSTNAERIEKKKAEIVAAQEKISRLKKEIAELENFEINALAKDIKTVSSETKSLILELIEKDRAAKKAEAPE